MSFVRVHMHVCIKGREKKALIKASTQCDKNNL